MCYLCQKFRVDVPEGKSGNWAVSRFEVNQTDVDFFNLRSAINPRSAERTICAGTYTKLTNNDYLVMSDTPSEIRDHLPMITNGHGRILLAGLGLGVILSALCQKDEVKSVTIVENSEDVVKLVGEHWKAKYGDKMEIILDDIFDWQPKRGSKWDYAWFDIWNDICSDNLKEMSMLQKKFAKRARIKGFWGKDKITRGPRGF